MVLARYLGGIGLAVIGVFILLVGIVTSIMSNNSSVCFVSSVIGILMILVGGFYARTSYQRVATKIEIVDHKQKSDRYCPDCGRAIPFDANICPYCGKKF